MVSVALEMREACAGGARPGLAEPDMAELLLPVTGGQPLRLRGAIFAEAHSWAPGVLAWHEIGLFRTAGPECAATLRTLNKAMGEADIHRAGMFPTLALALSWLERFDPTADLQPGFNMADAGMNRANLTLRAAGLRIKADAVTREWRCMLGELFFRLSQHR